MSRAVPARRLLVEGARLYHVADAAALPLIRRHGLLSAEALCDLFEVPEPRRTRLLSANRDAYETLRHPVHGEAALRRQLMRTDVLAPRLAPGIAPEEWRRFINRHVFFWPSLARAEGLDRYEPGRVGCILSVAVADLVAAGLTLLAAPMNGGGVFDRGNARRRGYDLYRPLGTMAERVVEVAVPGAVPSSIRLHQEGACDLLP
jgi:hypothetical protein